MNIRKVMIAVVLLGLLLALPACSGGGSSGYSTTPAAPATGGTSSGGTSSGSATIVEKGFAFSPAKLDVKVGDTVTFTNEDSAPHAVLIDGKNLGQQAQGASVTWTAATAGTFPFSCSIHPSMTGEITVK